MLCAVAGWEWADPSLRRPVVRLAVAGFEDLSGFQKRASWRARAEQEGCYSRGEQTAIVEIQTEILEIRRKIP